MKGTIVFCIFLPSETIPGIFLVWNCILWYLFQNSKNKSFIWDWTTYWWKIYRCINVTKSYVKVINFWPMSNVSSAVIRLAIWKTLKILQGLIIWSWSSIRIRMQIEIHRTKMDIRKVNGFCAWKIQRNFSFCFHDFMSWANLRVTDCRNIWNQLLTIHIATASYRNQHRPCTFRWIRRFRFHLLKVIIVLILCKISSIFNKALSTSE